MRVTVHGPNLADQSRGEFEVHEASCRDNQRVRYLFAHAGDDDGWTLDVESCEDVAATVYADHLAERPGSTAADYVGEFHFAPCCASLPTSGGES